jgi:hypothetical protein
MWEYKGTADVDLGESYGISEFDFFFVNNEKKSRGVKVNIGDMVKNGNI